MVMSLPSVRPHRSGGYDGGERWSENRIDELEARVGRWRKLVEALLGCPITREVAEGEIAGMRRVKQSLSGSHYTIDVEIEAWQALLESDELED
jgi:hypothetical protein